MTWTRRPDYEIFEFASNLPIHCCCSCKKETKEDSFVAYWDPVKMKHYWDIRPVQWILDAKPKVTLCEECYVLHSVIGDLHKMYEHRWLETGFR